MKRTSRIATTLFALASLVTAGACTYDLASDRATASRWDTRDGDDRRITERETTRTVLEQTSPPELESAEARAGDAAGPAGDERIASDFPTADDDRVDVEYVPLEEMRARRASAEDEGTTPMAAESPREERSAPMTADSPRRDEPIATAEDPVAEVEAPDLEEVAPENPRVAERSLAEIARDEAPTEPLVDDGFLRAQSCPMEVEGAKVSLRQHQDGPVLVFTTDDEGDVVELQNRVMALALTKDAPEVEPGATEDEDTRAMLDFEPEVQPPEETGGFEGGREGMPHNLPSELADDDEGATRGPRAAGGVLQPLPEAGVTVELLENGASVLFQPVGDDGRQRLTRQLRARVNALEEGQCPARTMSMLGADSPPAG